MIVNVGTAVHAACFAGTLEISPCAAGQRSAHQSEDTTESSYQRIHGRPSRGPADWIAHPVACNQQLQEVLYHKAKGEGIAKVCASLAPLPCHPAAHRSPAAPLSVPLHLHLLKI